MSPRSRPIAQRARTVTAQITRLKGQLSGRTRDAFKSDSHYRTWHEKTSALLAELEDEPSVLNEPGEYDQLPPAVVAEELGTTTEKVRQLIKGGEVLATGKPAHEYVSREELAASCGAGLTELLRRLGQEAHRIFEESLEYLRQGHIGLAERACRRLVARESMAGSFALPYETAFHLARGELDEVEARLSFIGRAEDAARSRLMGNLRRALRGMSFEDEAARATAAEIVGGPAMRRERRACRPEKPRQQYREAALKRAVLDMFAGAGQFVVNQVYYGVAGRADVVTAHCIYELKDQLTRRSFYHAFGQLHGYRRHLNPGKNVAIICNETNLSESTLREFEDIWGVPILIWGNPPYPIPTRLWGILGSRNHPWFSA